MKRFLIKKRNIIVIVVVLMLGLYVINLSTSYSNNNLNNNYLYDEILKNNSILDINAEEVDGLFYDNDNNTYYFKGNVGNNYIVLNNELWRIVAINSDKSVKVIKSSGIESNKLFKFNEDYNDYEYKDSAVMDELLSWYEYNLNEIDEYIKDSKYCVDYRNNECLLEETYKIGLLNISEVKRAGGEINTNNEAYYLYNGNDWWIIDTDYDQVLGSAFSGYVNLLGSIDKGFVDEEMTIRPVINLVDVTPISGDGTLDNPYFILK